MNLLNGENYEAEVVWEDEGLDIAILKTNAIKLPCMSFADCEKICLGERVFLVSNYNGCETQVNVEEGIISMIDNTFKFEEKNIEMYIENVMKVDIDIDEDNTGGVIVNERGELVGICSNKNDIMIPISRINNILNKLIENNGYKKIDLGIYGFGVDTINYIKGLKLTYGVFVEKVEDDSILKKIIKEGEIITKVDGKDVNRMCEIKEYADSKNVGEKIIFTIIRDNVEKDIEIVL